MIDSGPLLVANNKVYWWSINGPLLAANDKLSIGPPVDHLHQPTTQIACRRWPNIGISVGLTLAATAGPLLADAMSV